MRVVVIAAVFAAIATAPTAHADSTGEYLDWLDKYGFNVNEETTSSLVNAGQAICVDLRGGASPEGEARAVFRMLPSISEKQAGNLVTAAQLGLCSDTS